jgi:hypothetical protein
MIDRYCRCILFLMCFTFILEWARRILGWAGPTWPPPLLCPCGPAVSSYPDCTQGDVRTNKYTSSSIFVADFINNYSRLDQHMHLSDVAHLVYPAPPHYNIGNHLMHINNNKTLLDS